MDSNILITICARGGSKGIPKKNIFQVNGKPLIAYTIDFAKEFKNHIDCDIILSTDDQMIKNVALDYGLETSYLRPSSLANDEVGKVETIEHVLDFMEITNKKKYDYIIDLDVTSPLRTIKDLLNAIEILKKNKNAYNIFSVSDPNHNPYFDMVEKKENGFFDLVKNEKDYFSRQKSPEVYDMNASIYVFRRKFFELKFKIQITNKSLIYKMDHLCFEIDNPIEMEFLDFLIKKNYTKNIL